MAAGKASARQKMINLMYLHADEKKRETDEIERTKDKKESVELDANLLERVLNELG